MYDAIVDYLIANHFTVLAAVVTKTTHGIRDIFFRPSSPSEIEARILKKSLSLLQDAFNTLRQPQTERGDDQYAKEICRKYMQRATFLANYHWGRDSIIDQYRNAYYNCLIAEIAEVLEHYEEASNRHHYAAHTFRQLGELYRSYEYYLKSANINGYKNTKFKIRSLQRAVAVAREMADEACEKEALKQISKLTQTISSTINTAP
ncbi:MAG: hypothetical protein IJ503_10815 [Akkermansia sp.]|nr:hypothetical protein [Akkermansia sp.]